MANKEIEERKGKTMMIFIFNLVVFLFNSIAGTLLAWCCGYDWETMSFPSIPLRLAVGLWVVQGITWLTVAGMIFSWCYLKKLEKKKEE